MLNENVLAAIYDCHFNNIGTATRSAAMIDMTAQNLLSFMPMIISQ
jgi:hypothetical protein